MDTNTTCSHHIDTVVANLCFAKELSIEFKASDGVTLRGHYWRTSAKPIASVIVNAATGVQARYYHRYALFLAQQGFNVLTYDYRGIGASRPASLKACKYKWSDWGEYDFSAALQVTQDRGEGPVFVVGHSIGGILPGLASGSAGVQRMLTVGAQYAWWRDYAAGHRAQLFWKWHVLMPVLTAIVGYFPGRRLGWLEDLPKGVANEWSFRRSRIERSYPATRHAEVLNRFRAVRSDIMAVAATDDEYASQQAVRRGLSYFENAARTFVQLRPADLGVDRVGHFDLFHSRHENGFWRASAHWLATGMNPWPHRTACIALPGDLSAQMNRVRSSRPLVSKLVTVSNSETKALTHLLELDDYLLADVGLTRDEVRLYLEHRGIRTASIQNGRANHSLQDSERFRIRPHDGAW